jgi:peptide subunit release factor 1 (eRF1)
MVTTQASEFKAKCLALMDQVARTGETIVVTRNGRPVAELHKGTVEVHGDIVATAGAPRWEAMK